MAGISVGAVSTIFIATPLLVGPMERDPEYAARKDAPTAEDARGRLLRRAKVAAAYEPTPGPPIDDLEHAIEHAHADAGDGDQEAKRERRRQRRRAKAQGRR